jgi:hypothetical protein
LVWDFNWFGHLIGLDLDWFGHPVGLEGFTFGAMELQLLAIVGKIKTIEDKYLDQIGEELIQLHDLVKQSNVGWQGFCNQNFGNGKQSGYMWANRRIQAYETKKICDKNANLFETLPRRPHFLTEYETLYPQRNNPILMAKKWKASLEQKNKRQKTASRDASRDASRNDSGSPDDSCNGSGSCDDSCEYGHSDYEDSGTCGEDSDDNCEDSQDQCDESCNSIHTIIMENGSFVIPGTRTKIVQRKNVLSDENYSKFLSSIQEMKWEQNYTGTNIRKPIRHLEFSISWSSLVHGYAFGYDKDTEGTYNVHFGYSLTESCQWIPEGLFSSIRYLFSQSFSLAKSIYQSNGEYN